MNTKKEKFVYLVWCNPNPSLLYAIYSSKKDAVKYAISLIRYRKEVCEKHGYNFGYYSFTPLPTEAQLSWANDPNCAYYGDVSYFHVCLKIGDKRTEYSDDGCVIKVERRILI